MEILTIKGGRKLRGSYTVPAAKNAVLPILAASIMLDGKTCINSCPFLADTEASRQIICHTGSRAFWEDGKFSVFYADSDIAEIPQHLCSTMRSAVLYLAPLLYRKGKVTVYTPGGCNIGARPVDIHLDGLEKLGAEIETDGCKITVKAPKGLKGANIKLRLPSVGATQTLIMAAAVADGITVLKNCAREPEIVDLARFLNCAGAKITGAGKNEIIIRGVSSLEAVEYTPIPDRIVAATVLSAVNAAKGICILHNYPVEYMQEFEKLIRQTGIRIIHFADSAVAFKSRHIKTDLKVHTGYYPDFSTDMGPLLAAATVNGKGMLTIRETVFENRFSYSEEFGKLGICCKEDKCIYIQQNSGICCSDANLVAKDLRAGAAVVVAALAGKGNFTVEGVEYIDRGYENIEKIFADMGAEIRRVQLEGK